MTKMKIDVLGTKYTVIITTAQKDSFLKQADGYCDKTSKKIVVKDRDDDCELEIFEVYKKTCLRHEIIHAFLFESGLHQNFHHDEWGHEETMVDWIATQFPKMVAAFKAADAL